MDNSGDISGFFSRLFAGGSAPTDIRPPGLLQTQAQQAQPARGGGGSYNAMGDIGMRLMAAGQPMTSAQRQAMIGQIPGAVAQNNAVDQERQRLYAQMQQGQHPVVGLLGNGAPMTPQMAAGNNDVWENLKRGMNADGSANNNAGFPGANLQHYAQPIAGQNPYGVY